MSNRIFDTVGVNCLQLNLLFSWQHRETWEMLTVACSCEGHLVQAGGCLGHPPCETKHGAARSVRVEAPAIAHWGKEQAQRLPSAPGMRGKSMAVPLQQVLGPTLEHPQHTQTWPKQCSQCSKCICCSPLTPVPGWWGFLPFFMLF